MTKKCIKFRFALIAITLFMVLQSVTPVFSAEIKFSDLQGHWSETYVNALVAADAISDSGDGLFKPDELITFGQFITIIMTSKYGKQDLSGDDLISPYLEIALKDGIIDQNSLPTANTPMDRLSAIMLSHLFLTNVMQEEDSEYYSAAEQLVDYDFCPSCRAHLEQCYAKGIVVGRPGSVFDGEAKLTKAEACTIIAKTINLSLRTPPIGFQDEENSLITPEAAVNLLKNHPKAILLDVRSQEEYDKSHISGSVLMTLDEITDPDGEKFDKDSHIIVYCSAGSRSRRAYNYFIEQGYKNVYNLGGILDTWPYSIESGNAN